MKIALCFAGQFRNVKVTYDGWMYPNVIKPNEHLQLDIFAHGWFDKNVVGDVYATSTGVPGSNEVPENIIELVYDLYDPKSVRLEKQLHFDIPEEKFLERKYPQVKPQYSTSRMYSTHQVYNDVENSNITYDLIAITRWDWIMFSEVLFENYTDGSIWHAGMNPHGLNVGFVCGVPAVMKTYMNLFNVQEEVFDTGVPYCDEFLAEKNIQLAEIPIKSMNIRNSIHRGWKIG